MFMVRSASVCVTPPRAAAPKSSREDSCPVRPKGSVCIIPQRYARGSRLSNKNKISCCFWH